MSDNEYPVWPLRAFVSEFRRIHRQMPDRRFAFVLGAGASKPSGIPTGAELVDKWIKELRERTSTSHDDPISEWATAESLQIDGFEYLRRAEFYPAVYERRFAHDKESGYAYLEQLAAGKQPSFGYCVLARILAEERHKVVVTTNFDNLVAEAFSIVSDTTPFVCGHESLATFIVPAPRRPVVAKVHRDLLMRPKNERAETDTLDDEWRDVLEGIVRSYTPIVIGYAGNDGSLMGFLESFEERPYPGPLYWCLRSPASAPTRVQDLLRAHDGIAIEIPGFDELMAVLSEALEHGSMEALIEERSRRQLERLQGQTDALQDRLRSDQPTKATEGVELARSAIAKVVERDLDHLRSEPKGDYRALARLGTRLVDSGEWDEAERVLGELLALNEHFEHSVKKARTLHNLGRALQGSGRYGEAANRFQEALAIVEKHGTLEDQAIVLGNWAALEHDRGRLEDAARLFRQAVKLDQTTGRTAGLAFNARKLAEVLLRLEETQEACEMLQLAAESSRAAGNSYWASRNYGELGTQYRRDGQLARAREAYLQALEIADLAADTTSLAITHDNLGVVDALSGDLLAAETQFRSSAWLDEQTASPWGAAKSYANLGMIYWKMGEKGKARLHWDRARTNFEAAGLAAEAKKLKLIRKRLEAADTATVGAADYF